MADKLAAELPALSARLGDPATYSSGSADVAALNRDLQAARDDAERLTARWEELETKRSTT